jgi:hypothetical protein
VPYFWFQTRPEDPALPFPTVFTDRFWDVKRSDGWERTGVGTDSMTPWFGPVPPLGPLTAIQGDARAWAEGYLYSDYLAGRYPPGICWRPVGGKGGGSGGGRIYFASRMKVLGGGGGGGAVQLRGRLAEHGGGAVGGAVALAGRLADVGGGSAGGNVALAGRLADVGGGSGAGKVALTGRLAGGGGGGGGGLVLLRGVLVEHGGGAVGGAVALAGRLADVGGGSAGGNVALAGRLADVGGGSAGGNVALAGRLADVGGGSGAGVAELLGVLATHGGGSGGGTVALAVPPPVPGTTCATGGHVVHGTTYGHTVVVGTDDWWVYLALPAATYTLAFSAGGSVSTSISWETGACSGLTIQFSGPQAAHPHSYVHAGGDLHVRVTAPLANTAYTFSAT